MAITDKTTLKNWFKNKLKPSQEQFWAWMDSFWHKDESIPTSKVQSLDVILNSKATTHELANLHTQITSELGGMSQQLVLVADELGGKVDVEEGKQLSAEDFTTMLKQKLEGIDMAAKLNRGNYAGTGEDLHNGIQNILAVLASDDTTLDELQEIVDYIKQNKSDLEKLGISNIAGLADKLAELTAAQLWEDLGVNDINTIRPKSGKMVSIGPGVDSSTSDASLRLSRGVYLRNMESMPAGDSLGGVLTPTAGLPGRPNHLRYKSEEVAVNLTRLTKAISYPMNSTRYNISHDCDAYANIKLTDFDSAPDLVNIDMKYLVDQNSKVTVVIPRNGTAPKTLSVKWGTGAVADRIAHTESGNGTIALTTLGPGYVDLLECIYSQEVFAVNQRVVTNSGNPVPNQLDTKLSTGGYTGTAQDLYNLTQSNYSGIVLPTDGSTGMPRAGTSNIDWLLREIKLVLLADDLSENAVIADYNNPEILPGADLTGASGQVMTKFQKFYYREIEDGNGVLVRIEIAPIKFPGFKCHPKFIRPNGTEREFIYVGAYEAGDDGGTKLKSASGVAPLTGQPLATFRSRAFTRGAGWYPFDFWTQHLIQLLFYMHYGTFNSQTALPGYTERTVWNDADKRKTGRSNFLTTMNGTVAADLAGVDADLNDSNWRIAEKNISNRFLFVENIFGHIWKFLDGCSFDGRVGQSNLAYATANPALFSSVESEILAKYNQIGAALPASSNENYLQSLQTGFLPKAHGGGSSTYVTDYFWSYLDDASRDYFRGVLAGGSLNDGGQAGVAVRYSIYGLGNASSAFGSRLCAAP